VAAPHRIVQVRRALVLFGLLALITGIAYPLLVLGVAQVAFPHEANGSLILEGDTVVGSELIGQPFASPQYFWGRPSATGPYPYNAGASSGSNLGPYSGALADSAQARIDALRAADPGNTAPIPVDLVTASGSGLDPHISVAAALYQVPRVARERNMTNESVEAVVAQNTQDRDLGVLGEPRVNVLALNRALDDISTGGGAPAGNALPRESGILAGLPIAGWVQIVVIVAVVLVAVLPLGLLMAAVFRGDEGRYSRWFTVPAKRLLRISGIREPEEMDWKTYLFAVLVFNAIGMTALFALQMAQGALPLNPMGLPAPTDHSAFNTAASFTTNTNWQSYGGETTMSYLTQMLGLTVQNFVSAATGIAVLMALIRGISRRKTWELGNFWVDLVRAVAVLLPISFVLAIILASQGVPQTLDPYASAQLLDPAGAPGTAAQTIAVGPVASQEAIKMLGTNGGGFFNANSAHPYENPTPLSNLLETVAILLIPASLCVTFGQLIGDRRQGWALLAAMTVIFLLFLGMGLSAEIAGNPVLASMGADQTPTGLNIGSNMEGKEVRFGIGASALWGVATTATSNGGVNSMHDSYMPMGSFPELLNMQLGEAVFGGVGCGLYSMIAYVLIAVFVAGLMVGRMPQYMGKKLDAREMQLSIAIFLLPVALILFGTAYAVLSPDGRAGLLNHGPHGLSEILYAFSSASGTNGSAFAGLSANSAFYNYALAACMILSRFLTIVFVLMLADSLVRKRSTPPSAGSLPTHTPTFVGWLDFNVLLLGALSFLPVLALGPIAEHLMGG
jgi:K+-transporting ATPase ATPase A chain